MTVESPNVSKSFESGEEVVDLAVAGQPQRQDGKSWDKSLGFRVYEADYDLATLLVSLKTPQLFSLAKQGVIVTGGARGLGLAMAISLLEASAAHVYCVDILPSPVADEWSLAQRTAKEFGSKIEYRRLDITDEEAVTSTFADIYSTCSFPVKGFFAAAGIQQMIPALDYPAKDFRRIMEVNVTGTSITMHRDEADQMQEPS